MSSVTSPAKALPPESEPAMPSVTEDPVKIDTNGEEESQTKNMASLDAWIQGHYQQIHDVVFLVEKTKASGRTRRFHPQSILALEHCLADVRNAYLVPVLEHFNGSPLPPAAKAGSKRAAAYADGNFCLDKVECSNTFSLVTFGEANVSIRQQGPFSSPCRLLQSLDQLPAKRWKDEQNGNLSGANEGFAKALAFLDKLQSRRKGLIKNQVRTKEMHHWLHMRI